MILISMAYSTVGILAAFVHIIVNADVLFGKGTRDFPGAKWYLCFLISVILFHVTDGCWGLLYENHLSIPLFVDTTLYFFGMGLSILFWGLFVGKYLESESRMLKPITIIGYLFFIFQVIVVIINLFPATRIVFDVTETCEYIPGPLRYVSFGLQVVMYLLLAVFIISVIASKKGQGVRKHIALLFFSLTMVIFVFLQVFFTLLPMHSLGYLFGIVSIHTFVLEQQKAERQRELEHAKYQVEIDPLTGVKSKHAYVDVEAHIDEQIASGEMSDFALVVFDLNDLKKINDSYGHEAGDLYIIAATKLIKAIFARSEVYRIGGDEFVGILTDEDYKNRDNLLKEFNDTILQNIKRRGVVVSSGLSTYNRGKDNTYVQVFNRADKEMYQRKHELKETN